MLHKYDKRIFTSTLSHALVNFCGSPTSKRSREDQQYNKGNFLYLTTTLSAYLCKWSRETEGMYF
jgi:7-keto-8-aminopelargonate synthetase-like enzyme